MSATSSPIHQSMHTELASVSWLLNTAAVNTGRVWQPVVNAVTSIISKDLASGPGPGLITQKLLCSSVLLEWKTDRESFWHRDIRSGTVSAPLASLSKRAIYFLIGYYSESKVCLISFKIGGEIKSFSDKQKLEFSATKPTLQQILKGLM